MKKILFVTYGNPEEASKGDDLYTWNCIKSIKHNNDVYLHVVCYFEEAKEKGKHYHKLAQVTDEVTYVPFVYKNILAIGFSKYPAMVSNRKTPQMIGKVRELLNTKEYDAVVINMFRLAYLIEYIKDFSLKKVFISHNVESQLSHSAYKYQKNPVKKLAYYLDYIKTKIYERRLLPQYDAITTICDVDKVMFESLFSKLKIEVLPPIVDLNYSPTSEIETENRFIICGAFHWEPKYLNLKMLLSASTINEFKKHNMELMIVGRANKKDVDYVNANYPGIVMTGPVESVEPYYEKARIAIVPELVGGGFKLKIAEAVKYGKPIVAIKGSVTDTEMKPGIHYEEADTFSDLIMKAIELMSDDKKQRELVKNSKTLFSTRYSIDSTSKVILSLL